MKQTETLLIAGGVALGLVASYQTVKIRDQQAQLVALQERAKAVSLNLQATCAEQASKKFSEFSSGSKDMASYENHYSMKLGKCFVYLKSFGQNKTSITSYAYVADAFENKDVADFYLHTQDYTQSPLKPSSCNVTSPSGQEQHCKSEDEFKKLIQVYMQG